MSAPLAKLEELVSHRRQTDQAITQYKQRLAILRKQRKSLRLAIDYQIDRASKLPKEG